MTSLPSPVVPIAPAIQTRQQLETVLENIAQLQRERDELHCAQEAEIEAVRQRYRAPLTEIGNYLELETGWAEAWTRAHLDALDAERKIACEHATIGFRAEPPRIERASRRWNWTRIATTLGQLDWGRRYLRTTAPEVQVNKEAIVADLDKLSPVELRTAGIRVEQGEKFYVEPRVDAKSTTTPEAESAWQEAA